MVTWSKLEFSSLNSRVSSSISLMLSRDVFAELASVNEKSDSRLIESVKELENELGYYGISTIHAYSGYLMF